MIKIFAVLFIISSIFASNLHQNSIKNNDGRTIIKWTNYGFVEGFSVLNGTIDVFFSIPFAKPPLGKLRFEKPQRPESWRGILKAKKHKKSCFSHAPRFFANETSQMSEDCLYLNIFAPHRNGNSKILLPVFFLIHGGGFEVGNSKMFSNFTDIGQNFVKHGIVVVSIQYRLGQFGFGSTGDSVLPGNLGLWDQNAALKWVSENIVNFGGDSNQITLFGQSAGAASVSAHTLSPHSRDLFARAIQMSGSAISSWVYGSRVANETKKLARALGCPTNSMAIKNCLKQRNPVQIQNALIQIGTARNEPNTFLFQPRIDGDFFPKSTWVLALEAPSKPVLLGFTKLEYELFALIIPNSSLSLTALNLADLPKYGAANLQNYIRRNIAYEARFGNASEAVTNKIFAFYNSSNLEARGRSQFYVHQYCQLGSDLMFGMAPLMEAKLRASKGSPVYMFISNYANTRAFPAEIKIRESFHGLDLSYVFDWLPRGFEFNAQDRIIQAFMQESMRNFIKFASPSTKATSSLNWPKVEGFGDEFKHVEVIAPKPVVRSRMPEEERHLTWRKLGQKYPQFDLLFETETHSIGI